MKNSKMVDMILKEAMELAIDNDLGFVTPEHILLVASETDIFKHAARETKLNTSALIEAIEEYLDEVDTSLSRPEESYYYKETLKVARFIAKDQSHPEVKLIDVIHAMVAIKIDSILLIEKLGVNILQFLNAIQKYEMKSVHGVLDPLGKDVSLPTGGPEAEGSVELLKDLCLAVKENPEPLIGREPEILRTIEILGRAKKNNPIHVGEPGVGKTAIAKGLADKINNGEVPDRLKNAKVFALDLGSLISGTKYRGEFEQRLKSVLEGLKDVENPILYIDEIHNIVGLGAGSESSFDGANILKDYLTDGKIKFIGATTHEEYKKHFQKDKALNRRFQPVDIKEPSIAETIEILNGLKSYYENFHGVKYTKEAIESAVTMSHKYIQDRFLPDKAIDLIDEAGAKVSMSKTKKSKRITKVQIEEIIATLCKIPKESMQEDESGKLKTLSENIKKNVYGQDEAIELLVNNIKLSRAGLTADRKPVASVLFVGPTGVGKTEVARTLANELGIGLIKFDMSEYAEEHSVSKLIGAPAGYVGYEEGGLLVEKIRQTPHCVLLLDEIEKAHPKIFNILLQVMDDAQLTDNQGRKADFRNVILIMTSNAGAASVGKPIVGFGAKTVTDSNIKETVNRVFSPEFRNRLTDTVVFNAMDESMGELVVKKELSLLGKMLESKNVTLNYSDEAINYILKKGMSKEYGARQIQRIVSKEIKQLFVDELLFGGLTSGGTCTLNVKEDKPVIEIGGSVA